MKLVSLWISYNQCFSSEEQHKSHLLIYPAYSKRKKPPIRKEQSVQHKIIDPILLNRRFLTFAGSYITEQDNIYKVEYIKLTTKKLNIFISHIIVSVSTRTRSRNTICDIWHWFTTLYMMIYIFLHLPLSEEKIKIQYWHYIVFDWSPRRSTCAHTYEPCVQSR